MADIQYPPYPAGTFDAAVIDNDNQPSTVLDASLAFRVEGTIVLNSGNLVTGRMDVTVYVDELGGQIDQSIGSTSLSIPGDGTFSYTVVIPANTLPETPTGSGVYQVGVLLTHRNSFGIPTELTAFEDLGAFRIS